MEEQNNNLEVFNESESLNVESESLNVEQEDTLYVDSAATDINDIFKSMGKRQ